MKDYQKELITSTLKTTISLIPIYGGIINEIVFEYSGRLKQKRLNQFTELLIDYINESNIETNLDNIDKDDFTDVLESILLKVTRTKSLDKLKHYRDLLFHCIETKTWDIENTERFLDLIYNLKEYEIIILNNHLNFDDQYDSLIQTLEEKIEERYSLENILKNESTLKEDGFANNYDRYLKEIEIINNEIKKMESYKLQLSKNREAYFYNLNEEEFLYSKQKLYSLGLLIDSGIGAIDVEPFEIMSITSFGKRFINFIINSK